LFSEIRYYHQSDAAVRESMPMIPFMERFPEVGARETRSVTVPQRQDLPEGEYGFVELYCDESACDCRRVMIDVLRPETGWSKVWATISYGWESLDFYRQWGGAGSDPVQIKGPYLDPLNPQTKYSSALLNLFRSCFSRRSMSRVSNGTIRCSGRP
jgi:hypothetical protein